MNKIDAKHVNFFYGDFQALKDISMTIEEKSVVAFIGPSGCGKSTFLRLFNRMNDLIPGSRLEGEILIDGRNIYDKSVQVDELRKSVGMVFQRPNPFPKSIFENVAYGLRVNGVKDNEFIRHRVEETLKGAALWDEVKNKLKESAFALSGGQQQRLCIARAMAVSPSVLLMDEPASALDPISTAKVEELIHELKKEYIYHIHRLSSIGIFHNKSVHNLCITTICSTDNVNFSPQKKLRHPAGSDVPAHRKSLRPPQSRYYRLFLLKNIIAFESMMCYTES